MTEFFITDKRSGKETRTRTSDEADIPRFRCCALEDERQVKPFQRGREPGIAVLLRRYAGAVRGIERR